MRYRRGRSTMGNSRRTLFALLATGACAGMLALAIPGTEPADDGETPVTETQLAHAKPHTAEQLKAFDDVFMEEVRKGDLLFHGDTATEKKMGVKLTSTGMACAMCHPMSADIHPHEFPKFQEQI